jgi:hypothetical protein
MYNHKSSPTLSNCTFTGSDVEIRGGAMYNYDNSNPTLTNCILYYNTSPLPEHEIYNYLSTPQISYSDIEGCLGGGSWDASLGSNGGGNIDMDPLFVDADGDDNIYGTEDDDLRLSPGSPCIGAGSNGTDMGAYEFGDTTPTTYMLSVYASGATSVPISSSTGHSGTINYSKTVNDGTTVTLTAPILSGKDFTGWTGSATSGNRTVLFSMNANKTVTANYEASAPTTYSLNVYSDGATGVAISSSTGHAGTTDYIKTINEGTTVTLTAPILSGKDFTDWTGSVSSSSRTISFAMNANKFVTANYEPTTPTLSSISISGSTQVNESSSAQYTATATYSDGSTANVTSSASWTENSSYASISSSGYLTTNSVSSDKSCTITASYGGKTDTHAVTIKNVATVPTLSYITISGSTQVDENSGAQYTCRAYYSDGSSTNVTSAAGWSENSSYASISSTGYLTTASVSSDQSCTITATYGGKSDMHAVTIQDAPSTGTNLTVSSSGASNVTITSTTGFGGTTNYSKAVNDGSLVILAAPATWNGATFTGWTGSVTSSSATIWFTMSGTKSLTANYSGGGGTTPTLSSIAISGSIQVDESSGAQYTCTAYYSDGSSTNVTSSASWSENSSYASISSSGYLTTNSVSSDQSCTVTASYGGKSDTHSVTIKNAPTGCVPSTVSVGAIVPGTSRGSRGRAFGSVTVTVSDNCGNAVANAVVYGTFSGDYSDTLAATTNAQGVATFKTTTEAKKPAYTFCVNNIVKAGLTYRSVDNVESCDSY